MIAYIVPFLFIFFPALLFQGTPIRIITATVTALFGCFMLSAALTGYFFQALRPAKRVLYALVGIGLMIPVRRHIEFSLIVNIVSAVIMILLFVLEWRIKKEDVRV